MGIGENQKKRQRLTSVFKAKLMDLDEQKVYNEVIEHVIMDAELWIFSQVTRALAPEMLYQSFSLFLKNLKDTHPNVKTVTFVFDYDPSKPQTKKIIRSEKRTPESIPDEHVALLDLSLYFGPRKTSNVPSLESAMLSAVVSHKTMFARYMHTPYLRRCSRRFLTEVINSTIAESGIETVNVCNVLQENGEWIDYHNGVPRPTEGEIIGEAEMAIVKRISNLEQQDVVKLICGDSDLLGVLPMYFMTNKQAPRTIIDFGTVTKVFDANSFSSGLLQWGQMKSVGNMEVAFAVECAMGGTDYVRTVKGLGDARINAFMTAGGYRLVADAVDVSEGLKFDIEKMKLFIQHLMAFDKPRGVAKNEREELFVKFKTGEEFELPSLEESMESTKHRESATSGICVPNVDSCYVFMKQVMWQIHYWFSVNCDAYPDPFERRDDLSVWGWEKEDEKLRIAKRVFV